MLTAYLPILVFIFIATGLGVALLAAGRVMGGNKPDDAKNDAYECGFDAIGDARLPFDVRFYLVAILFIIFDLETAFFVPWAVVLKKVGWVAYGSMMLFLALLVIGFIYEWKKGALEWE